MRNLVRPASLRLQATEQIREAIVVGALGHDTLHSEQTIAATMSISRTPIRESLLQLANEGFVEFIPRRGVRITPCDPAHLAKVFQYRMAIDGFCAELLARTRSREVLRELDAQVARQRKIISRAAWAEWVRANMDFHRVIVASVGNPMMSDAMSSLASHTMRAGYQMIHQNGNKRMKQAFVEHAQIVKAIRDRKSGLARKLAMQHLRRTADALALNQASDQMTARKNEHESGNTI
jgi:DNA-binding GntR family transcriptional regulator